MMMIITNVSTFFLLFKCLRDTSDNNKYLIQITESLQQGLFNLGNKAISSSVSNVKKTLFKY